MKQRRDGTIERFCPECREPLAPDSDACACGWGSRGKRATNRPAPGPQYRMRCAWHVAGLECVNPVGMFSEGRTSGFCLLHRATPEGCAAAEIAEESHALSPEEFIERCMDTTYGPRGEDGTRADNANVTALRARLRERAEGGSVGLFASRLVPWSRREPGAEG